MTFKSYLLAIGLAAAAPLLPATEAETRLLRFPTTNGEHIVFSYAGQLYTVPAAGHPPPPPGPPPPRPPRGASSHIEGKS